MQEKQEKQEKQERQEQEKISTLIFPGLPTPLRKSLEEELNNQKVHPLNGMEHVEVISHPEGLVFRLNEGNAGYSFCRNVWGAENDVAIFRYFLNDLTQRHYMSITYEVKERSAEVAKGILERYQNYGLQHANKIDWIWFNRNQRHLLILRIPKEIIREMMHKYGGTLTTQVRGPVGEIRKLGILSKIVPEDAKDEEVMQRAFVTPYKTTQVTDPVDGTEYYQCMAVHQAALKEVMLSGPKGISIGPIAVWKP